MQQKAPIGTQAQIHFHAMCPLIQSAQQGGAAVLREMGAGSPVGNDQGL